MSTKRKPIINTHCHFLNLKFIPGEMVELLAHITEDMAQDEWFAIGAGLFFELNPGNEFKRISRFLRTFRLPIDRVVKEYIKRMDEASIDICVPLLIDFEQSILDARTKETDIPYYKRKHDCQITLISEQVALYPWRIFPFVMFDPRRKNSVEICIEAIEQRGYVGIKMYPALGYHPCPEVNKNPGTFWGKFIKKDKKTAKRLQNMYEYCRDGKIPITTHIDVEGAFTSQRFKNSNWIINNLIKMMELNKIKETEVWPLNETFNWLMAIKMYNLKINFAHMGGNYLHHDKTVRKKASRWRNQILKFIAFTKDNNWGSVYSDLSYHYMALQNKTQQTYFRDLQDILKVDYFKSRLLFGTDASLLSHTWKEVDYIQPYKNEKYLDKGFQTKIFSDNPTKFLFKEGKIPESYVNYIKNNATPGAFEHLPDWVIKKADGYYIVTDQDIANI